MSSRISALGPIIIYGIIILPVAISTRTLVGPGMLILIVPTMLLLCHRTDRAVGKLSAEETERQVTRIAFYQEPGHLRQPCRGRGSGGWIGVSGGAERAEGPLEGPYWAVGACSERPATQAGRPLLSSQHHRFMLYAMLASVTVAWARAMPMVRITSPITPF